MDLPDVKQLEKIIAMCRKRGVKSIRIDNVEVTLSESAPVSAKSKVTSHAPINSQYTTDSLTEEELLMWSVGGNTDPSQVIS